MKLDLCTCGCNRFIFQLLDASDRVIAECHWTEDVAMSLVDGILDGLDSLDEGDSIGEVSGHC